MRLTFFLITLCSVLFSETFIKEYTYNASENDSKLSARKAALNQIKMLVIEEVGVNVRSSYFKEESQNNEDVSKVISAKLETFAHAVTKTSILEERWNGEQFYLKAKVIVDADKIALGFDSLSQKLTPKQQCEALGLDVQKKLYDLSSQQKINNFSLHVIDYPFDDCNAWHYKVMQVFSKNKINPESYRRFLLRTLDEIEAPSQDKRTKYIIAYLTPQLSKYEFEVVLSSMKRMQDYSFAEVSYFLASKQDPIAEFCFDRLFEEAKKKEIGRPLAFSIEKTSLYLLSALDEEDSIYFNKYYLEHEDLLSQRAKDMYYKSFRQKFFKYPTDEDFNIILAYLNALSPSSKSANTIFNFVSYCETKAKKEAALKAYFQTALTELKQSMKESFPLTNYASGRKQRNDFLIRYQI